MKTSSSIGMQEGEMHGMQRYLGWLRPLQGNEVHKTAKRIRRCVVE